MKIYIAGPYTGKDARETQLNVNRAIETFCLLLREGFIPFLPHLTHYVWMHPEGDFPYEKWLEYDLHWVDVCDAVYRMPGDSNGADGEVRRAKELGKSVYYDLTHLKEMAAGIGDGF